MDAIRDLIDNLGLQPQTFDMLIYLTIVVGGIWAAVKLYRDLTTPTDDEIIEGKAE